MLQYRKIFSPVGVSVDFASEEASQADFDDLVGLLSLAVGIRVKSRCNVSAVTRKFYGRRQKLPESSVVQDRRVWNYLEEEYSLIIVTQQPRAELSSTIKRRLTPRT
jgi:hypothetical protein